MKYWLSYNSLAGTSAQVDVTTNVQGSSPISGSFTLIHNGESSSPIPYSSSIDSAKQALEALPDIGSVEVTRTDLTTYRIPTATVNTALDGVSATVSNIDDVRTYLSPGDKFRLGSTSNAVLVGSNGDLPLLGTAELSTVTVSNNSPLVFTSSSIETYVYPGQQMRVDGGVYNVKRTGIEIQTLTIKVPEDEFSLTGADTVYKLEFLHKASTAETAACLPFNADATVVASALNGLTNVDNADIVVTRSGPKLLDSGVNKGYVYTIYFEGASVLGNVNELTVTQLEGAPCSAIAGTTVVGDVSTIVDGGRTAHQRISLTTNGGTVADTSGYYKLGVEGVDNGNCIKWGASADDLKAAVVAAGNTLTADEIYVSRSGNGQSVTELQKLIMTSNTPVTVGGGGLFKLSFTHGGVTATTSTCLHYGVSAADLQIAIDNLANVPSGHISVTQEGDASATWGYGYEYSFEFKGLIASSTSSILGNVNPLVVHDVGTGSCTSVASGSPSLRIMTAREGRSSYTYEVFFIGETRALMTPMTVTDQGIGGACATGWVHSDGSSRNIAIEVVDAGGSDEVQTVTIKDESGTIAGTPQFKLYYQDANEKSNCINHDDLGSEVETALAAIDAIGVGGVTVSAQYDPILAPNGVIYQITFTGQSMRGNVDQLQILTGDCGGNTLGTVSVSITTAQEGGVSSKQITWDSGYTGESPGDHVGYTLQQTFTVGNGVEVQKLVIKDEVNGAFNAAGTYTLNYGDSSLVGVEWDATEDELEENLASLTGITAGDVHVSRITDANEAPNGFVYYIYFTGTSVRGNVVQLVADNEQNFDDGTAVFTTVIDGNDDLELQSALSLPLAAVSDATIASKYYGVGTSLGIYKVNGFLWTIKFETNLGDIPELQTNTGALTGTLTVYDNFVSGSLSNTYTISGLNSGVVTYAKVAATTDIGTGATCNSVEKVPRSKPMAPQNVESGVSLHADEVQIITTAATHIDEVQQITTAAASIAEVQTFTVTADSCADGNCVSGEIYFRIPSVQKITVTATASITSGTFKITYVPDIANVGTLDADTPISGTVVWNADTSDIETILNALNVIVTKEGDGSVDYNYGYTFYITFIGLLGEVKDITVSDNLLDCGVGCTANVLESFVNRGQAMGTDTEVQEVLVKADKALSAGGYKLSFNNAGGTKVSACISYNAEAETMQTTIENLDNVDHVHVTRTQDSERAPNGYIYSIYFYGTAVSGDVNELTYTDGDCDTFQTYENGALTTTGVNKVIDITTVDEGGDNALNTFVTAASATAENLQDDLNRLPGFGNVDCTRSLKDDQGGYMWTVVFDESDGNVFPFVCTGSGAFNANCNAGTITNGNVLQGSFAIDSTSSLSYDSTADDVKVALEKLLWVGTVSVVATGPTGQNGYTWTISFLSYKGNVPKLTTVNSLTGVGNTITVTEVQDGNYLGGSFTLSYDGFTTDEIESTSEATGDNSVQERLQALTSIGAVDVSRTGPDSEGGYSWWVTFRDNILNSGDIPLITSDTTNLNGAGAVVSVREHSKGAEAVGTKLWLSFDPPESDSGADIDRYQVRWDTASNFLASPQEANIEDAGYLYGKQAVEIRSPDLKWSNVAPVHVDAIQTVSIVGTDTETFKLTFRGEEIANDITVGTTTFAEVKTELEALNTVTTVTVNPGADSDASIVTQAKTFTVTFTVERGVLPDMISSDLAVATISTTTDGATSYRKEVVVFKCTENAASTVDFTFGTETLQVDYDVKLTNLKALLEGLSGIPVEGISIVDKDDTPQTELCAGVGTHNIYITFHKNYGDLTLGITSSGASGGTITFQNDRSIDGYIYNPTAEMSGTFRLKYGDSVTSALSAGSSADDVRMALESLSTVTTVGTTRELSGSPLSGTVDVVKGQVYVTCATDQTCDFYKGRYGSPGQKVQIGGTWYKVATDTTGGGLPSDRLYLADDNNNQIAYAGSTGTGITVYEWDRGYIWTVDMYSVQLPLSMIRTHVHNLMPLTSTIVVKGTRCEKCYYIPEGSSSTLSMGETYYIQVNAHNDHGLNELSGNIAEAVPREVPSKPTNIDLRVVSGTELELFFSPPSIAPANVDPSYNDDITSYIVQWDTVSEFKHGLKLCESCVSVLEGNELTVDVDMTTTLLEDATFTVGSTSCVYTVASVLANKVTVDAHACGTFTERAYSLQLYTFVPVTVSGLEIQGTPPYKKLIQGLTNSKYYVRVAAVNSVPAQIIDTSGTNNRKWSSPVSATPVDTVPDAPLSVNLNVRSGTSLEVQIEPSLRDGGQAISHYVFDIDTVSSFDSTGKATPAEITVENVPLLYTGGNRVHYIEGLTEGVTYYVQVKAKNSIGYSANTVATTPTAPERSPDAPSSVKVRSLTIQDTPITSATVTWAAPTQTNGNGGREITNYKVEWWTTAARSEVQVVEITWTTPPTGSFTLSYGGGVTGSMPFDISTVNLRNMLMNIEVDDETVIGDITVTRTTINVDKGYQWSITFNDIGSGKNDGDIPMLQIAKTGTVEYRVFESVSGISAATSTVSGTREVQAVVTSSGTEVGGYFRLSHQGSVWTNYISASASAADVATALEQLPTISKVLVTEGTGGNGKHWMVTFNSNVGDQTVLLADGSKLTPDDATLDVKDGDNLVKSNGEKCLPGIDTCPGTPVWQSYETNIAQNVAIGEQAVGYGFYETTDANVLAYQIPNLTPGVSYYIQVSAKNSLGYGSRAASFPTSIKPPKQIPGKPEDVSVGVNAGVSTQLVASWNAPVSDGGNTVTKYRVEWDTTSNFDNAGNEEFNCPSAPKHAIWEIKTSKSAGNDIDSGYFQLKLTRGNTLYTTEAIPWNAVAMASDEVGGDTSTSTVFCTPCASCGDPCTSDTSAPFGRREKSGSMQSKLEYLSVISDVKVTRSVNSPADGGYTWLVTFLDVGDDFSFEAITTSSFLAGGGTYETAATKQTTGVDYPTCTGSKVIPSADSLTKGQLYYIRVFAYNGNGYGDASVAENPEKPMVVPGAPTGVILQVASVSELRVVFSPPDDNGGDTITEYEIEWADSAAFTNSQTSTTTLLSGGAPFYKIISGLTKGTYYFVRVRAKNSQGYGITQTSSPTSLNPHTTPSAPTQVKLGVTASTMITVQWSEPTDNGGDSISGYIVEWDTAQGFNSLEVAPHKSTHSVTDNTERSYTIGSLTAGRTYYVRVKAVNAKGSGTAQAATPTSGVPANARPGKPHTLTAVATGTSGELLVSWQAPRIPYHGIPCGGTLLVPQTCSLANGFNGAYGGSNLLSYDIQWNEASDFGVGTGGTQPTLATSYALQLTPNKLYYVRVLARNAQGSSLYCEKANNQNYLCPDGLVLLSGEVITGSLVSATTAA